MSETKNPDLHGSNTQLPRKQGGPWERTFEGGELGALNGGVEGSARVSMDNSKRLAQWNSVVCSHCVEEVAFMF